MKLSKMWQYTIHRKKLRQCCNIDQTAGIVMERGKWECDKCHQDWWQTDNSHQYSQLNMKQMYSSTAII